MPISPKTITLTATACDGGIRIYTKTPDGIVREICNDTTVQQLAKAVEKEQTSIINYVKPTDWFAGSLTFMASPESALCAIAWPRDGASWKISVFYQDADGSIREKYHKGGDWEDPKFEQRNCLIGTNIAALHSPTGDRVVLFYQGADNLIYSRVRLNHEWLEPVQVSVYEAYSGTGIAATVSDDWKHFRVFYQNKEYKICCYTADLPEENQDDSEEDTKRHFLDLYWEDNSDTVNWTKSYRGKPVGDITAVSWFDKSKQNEQIRVYIQDNNDQLQEHVYSDGKWVLGKFNEAVLRNADACAIVRPVAGKDISTVTMLWAGQDRHLYGCTNYKGAWLSSVRIATMMQPGTFAGTWIGEPFTDNDAEVNNKVIEAVHVREFNGRIAGIRIDYVGGTHSVEHGISNGPTKTFHLQKGDITQVWFHGDNRHVLGLKFGTNKFEKDKAGQRRVRNSEWYGTPTKGGEVWSENGMALVGFEGVQGVDGVIGLQPLWSSSRLATADLANIPKIVEQAKGLAVDMQNLTKDFETLTSVVAAHKTKTQQDLKDPIANTATNIVTMARSVEYLFRLAQASSQSRLGSYDKRENDFTAQKTTCNDNAKQVENLSGKLKSVSDDLKAKGLEIHGKVASLQKSVQEKSAILTRLKDSADALEEVIKSKNSDIGEKRDRLNALLQEDAVRASGRRTEVTVESIKEIIKNDKLLDLLQASSAPYRMPEMPSEEKSQHNDVAIMSLFKHAVLTLQARAAEIAKYEGQLEDIASKLKDLAFADASSDALEERTKATLQEIVKLHGEDDALCTQAAALANQLGNIQQWSQYLDKETVAQSYAKDLLEIIKVALGVRQLKAALSIHPDLLYTTVDAISKAA